MQDPSQQATALDMKHIVTEWKGSTKHIFAESFFSFYYCSQVRQFRAFQRGYHFSVVGGATILFIKYRLDFVLFFVYISYQTNWMRLFRQDARLCQSLVGQTSNVGQLSTEHKNRTSWSWQRIPKGIQPEPNTFCTSWTQLRIPKRFPTELAQNKPKITISAGWSQQRRPKRPSTEFAASHAHSAQVGLS